MFLTNPAFREKYGNSGPVERTNRGDRSIDAIDL
jgi:hypothetical protein